MRRRSRWTAAGAAAALAWGLAATTAAAQDTQDQAEDRTPLTVELNLIEQEGTSCRTYFVFENGGEVDFANLRLDVFVFNDNGIIGRRFLLDSGAVGAGGTRVRIADLPDTDCASVGYLLINGVLGCEDTDGAREDCASLINTRTRAEVELRY